MCGIAGILSGERRGVEPALVERMVDAIAHRGPDGRGTKCIDSVGLGHSRLSIIDLDTGRQPLCNEDESVWITFNGEIYNYKNLRTRLDALGHRFKTRSDTEVIVHAYEQWGPDCVSYLRGMFAFAIWDGREQRLFLARDRFGIKPLLYGKVGRDLVFASELQAFCALESFDRTVSPGAIDLYLHYQSIPAPLTIYENVRKLPPAHYLFVNADGTVGQPQRYWKLQFETDRSLDEREWEQRLHDALSETVQTHLVSDVPFGAFLSGGIDSSVVVSFMSRALDKPVQAFCIGHDRADFDERRWAREAADTCGATFHEEVVESDLLTLLPRLVKHYGEPFADSSALPTFHVSALAKRHVKMVLSGDGGDELFAGYNAYPSIIRDHYPPQGAWRRTKYGVGQGLRSLRLLPALGSPEDSKYARSSVVTPDARKRLWRPEYHHLLAESEHQFREAFRQASQPELLNQLQCYDIENYIANDNLPKVDIASMYHGLEVRVPLLDHVFVENVAQMPPEHKLRASGASVGGRDWLPAGRPVTGKYLLKKVAASAFSQEFAHRPKRGFEVPIQHWLQEEATAPLRERLLSARSPLAEWFDRGALEALVAESGQSKLGAWRAWSVLVLSEWCEQQVAPL